MQRELGHFLVDGNYGGSQDRMKNPWMKLGGCAALAAVDSCIYLALHNGMSTLCPFDATEDITEKQYNSFANKMRPYISPRFKGVNKLEIYVNGFYAYLRDVGCDSLRMNTLPMGTPYEQAEKAIISEIDAGLLVPILHLVPKTPEVEEYHWHWFLLNGYRTGPDGLWVKAVTYYEYKWVKLKDLWNENDPDNGGLILYSIDNPPEIKKLVRVAAAIICDRLENPTTALAVCRGYGEWKGKWEFPGGKLEPGESSRDAVIREINEELSVEIEPGKLMTRVEHDYPDFHLSMDCFLAVIKNGQTPAFNEAQDHCWINHDNMWSLDWLPADIKVIDVLHAEMIDADEYLRRLEAE